MKCPFCGHRDSKVADSRPTDDGSVIRRRRVCPACGDRFTTYEKADSTLVVVKKDGRREPFNGDKILRGLITASEKRPVERAVLEALVRGVERELRSRYEREVSSQDIGESVMQRLRAVDQVAYVRFASVYRAFEDLQHFKRELERLIQGGLDGAGSEDRSR